VDVGGFISGGAPDAVCIQVGSRRLEFTVADMTDLGSGQASRMHCGDCLAAGLFGDDEEAKA
jgi:hypothetical protein